MPQKTLENTVSDFEKIPGPPPDVLFGWRGNLLRFLNDPLAYMLMLKRTYGEIASFVRGRKTMIFTFHPRYNRQILGQPDLFNSVGITHLGPKGSAHRRVGHGILSMNGQKHRDQRRMLMPPFLQSHIAAYHDAVVAIVDDVISSWRDGERKNMYGELKKLTKRVSCKVLFGLDSTSKAFSVSHMMEEWLDLGINIKTRLLPYNIPGFPYARMLRLAERLEKGIGEMIDEKRNERLRGDDALSILIGMHDEDGKAMSEAELVGQANILFGASHETTSSALNWILFLLAMHPNVYADVVDELENELAGKPPQYKQLAQLPLLTRIIKEGMRLLAPPVYTYRLSTAPFELGTYRLPERTTVALSHYLTHHDPDIYPDPESFTPDRWKTCVPGTYEYIPFGAGPRACIGGIFATAVMKTALAMILPRFRLEVCKNANIARHLIVTLTPRHGMPMIIHKQDRAFKRSKVRGNIHEMVNLN